MLAAACGTASLTALSPSVVPTTSMLATPIPETTLPSGVTIYGTTGSESV